MTILAILEELNSTQSINEKLIILEREKNNTLLKSVFKAAYDKTITYGIKQIPEYESTKVAVLNLEQGMSRLEKFVSREVTGGDAVHWLKSTLAVVEKDDAVVIERIVGHDLRCGTSDSLASRVWPGLVPTFDVMLAHKDISGIKFPCFGQVKSDGARCHMTLQNGKAKAFSRNGKEIFLHGAFDTDLMMLINEGETLDGELVAVDANGKVLARKIGNGVVTKAVKGTISEAEAKGLMFMTWDIVDFTSTIPYNERIERLTKVYQDTGVKMISVLPTFTINNKEEAEEFFQECLSRGEEGAMMKNMYSVWVPKRTKDLGKMKAECENEMRIVGIQEGTGKYVGMLGAFICESEDGKVSVNVGTGLSDEQRKEYWNLSMKNKVVSVKYNQLITDKKTGQYSLFLPRFVEIRFDKSSADTLDSFAK